MDIDNQHSIAAPATEDESVQREIAMLRAKRAAIETARDTREASTALQEQLARERRALADAEALERAIAEHGKVDEKIAVISTTMGDIIVKRASALRYKHFSDKGEYTTLDCERLTRPSLVHPDVTVFDQMIEDQPALVIACANAISRLAGVRKEILEKK